jgi:hypothetical protein
MEVNGQLHNFEGCTMLCGTILKYQAKANVQPQSPHRDHFQAQQWPDLELGKMQA